MSEPVRKASVHERAELVLESVEEVVDELAKLPREARWDVIRAHVLGPDPMLPGLVIISLLDRLDDARETQTDG